VLRLSIDRTQQLYAEVCCLHLLLLLHTGLCLVYLAAHAYRHWGLAVRWRLRGIGQGGTAKRDGNVGATGGGSDKGQHGMKT